MHEIIKQGNVLSNIGGLFNMEKLANKVVKLISVKSVDDQLT